MQDEIPFLHAELWEWWKSDFLQSDRNNGHGHTEPMAALIRGDPPKDTSEDVEMNTSTNGAVKAENEEDDKRVESDKKKERKKRSRSK